MDCLVNESYACLLGESLDAGLPAFLIRFSGCNLDCRYCDTRYARAEPGTVRTDLELRAEARASGLRRVLLTGGEPMFQPAAAIALSAGLLLDGMEVLLETNGSLPLDHLLPEIIKVVDVKTPGASAEGSLFDKPRCQVDTEVCSAGDATPFLESNLRTLGTADQLKFVLTGRDDYLWALSFLANRSPLPISPGNVLFSPAWGSLAPADLADWMLHDRLAYRFHLQIHKVVWGDRRGT